MMRLPGGLEHGFNEHRYLLPATKGQPSRAHGSIEGQEKKSWRAVDKCEDVLANGYLSGWTQS